MKNKRNDLDIIFIAFLHIFNTKFDLYIDKDLNLKFYLE